MLNIWLLAFQKDGKILIFLFQMAICRFSLIERAYLVEKVPYRIKRDMRFKLEFIMQDANVSAYNTELILKFQ